MGPSVVTRRHRRRGGRGRRRVPPISTDLIYDWVSARDAAATRARLPPPPLPRVLRGALRYIAPPALPQIPPFQWPAIWGPPPIITAPPPATPPTISYRPPIVEHTRTSNQILAPDQLDAAASPVMRATPSTRDAATSPVRWAELTVRDAATSPVHWLTPSTLPAYTNADDDISDITTPPASSSSSLSSSPPQLTNDEIDALLDDVIARVPCQASQGFLGVPPYFPRPNTITNEWSPPPTHTLHPLAEVAMTARVLPQPPTFTTSITAVIQRTITPSPTQPSLQDLVALDDEDCRIVE